LELPAEGGAQSSRWASAGVLALEQLVEIITSGEVSPGDRLPTERELGRRLGLSRSTVREAIRSLELLGVLDSRQGDGTYVRTLDARLVLEATGFVSRLLRDEDVLEMFQVRAVLDSAAASLAAARADASDREELQRRFDEIVHSATPERYLEADMAFHAHIAALSGNRLLAALIESFSVRTHPIRLHTQIYASSGAHTSGQIPPNEHLGILGAILSGDPLAASVEAAAHARSGGADWIRVKESQQRPDQ
jgi:GntR family transcriptional repressor for pyruvate dehydrogenase complex